jgi:hypothetical protein
VAHLRTQIFDAVLAALSGIPEFSGADKVKRGRTRAVPQELLPAMSLTWADDDEQATARPCAGPAGALGYDRVLPLSIIVHLRDAVPEVEFDELCVSIEAAMAGVIEIDGVTIEMLLRSTRFFVQRETGLPLMTGRLVYLAYYKSRAADPQQAAA